MHPIAVTSASEGRHGRIGRWQQDDSAAGTPRAASRPRVKHRIASYARLFAGQPRRNGGHPGAPIGQLSADEEKPGVTSCVYPPGEAGSYAQAEVVIEWERDGTPTFERQLVDAFGGSAVGRQVAHHVDLGDEASYSREGVLSIRRGRTLITITLPMRPGSEVQAIEIGRKTLDRLEGAAAAPATERAVRPGSPPAKSDDASVIFKDLLGLFGDPNKPDVKDVTKDAPFPDGFEPGGECPEPEPSADAEIAAGALATIPLNVGLTLAQIWTHKGDDYDHECLEQVTAIDSRGVVITQSCPMGKDRHLQRSTRRLCRVDLRDSFMYETAEGPWDPQTLRGALKVSLSAKSFAALTTVGETHHRFLDLADPHEGQPLRLDHDFDGILKRVGKTTLKVIVNDRPLDLPVIEAAGTFTEKGREDPFRLTVVDDARFPLVLDYAVPGYGFQIRYTKISYPTGGELEKHLATERHVDVYGIYFDFASDHLRAESEPVLNEIAATLAKNADWKLTINGHTDNIGGDASNLELSRRRSESVRRALAERYRIDPARLTTAGFGASQPKEPNTTVEGRAENRRVELIRQ